MREQNTSRPAGLRYQGAFAGACGIWTAGAAVQLVTGNRAVPEPSWPANFILLAVFVAILIALHAIAGRTSMVRALRSVPAAISAIALVLVQSVIMGTLPQQSGGGVFHDVMHSWPFVLTMLYFLTNLGLATIARTVPFKLENLGFLLNHLGLWIALAAGMLGAGDLIRLSMELRIGVPEWRAVDRSHEGHAHILEMPFAFELKKFEMDTFAPKLAILDTATSRLDVSPRRAPVEISKAGQEFVIGDWHVTVEEYIPEALGFADNYHAMPGEVGAVPTVYVSAKPITSNAPAKKGWISCGSFAAGPAILELGDNLALAMPDPEPRRFASQVEVYTPNHEHRSATIEVNEPLALNGWKIYQLSYDSRRGRWSQTSIVELVRDPWLPGVYTGVFMMMAGTLFLMAKMRKARV